MDTPQLQRVNNQLIPCNGSGVYPEYAPAPGCVHEHPEKSQSGGLLEYFRILRIHKGALILISLFGADAGVLLTLPQTSVYRARTVLEIQDLNENFLNIKQVSPVSNGDRTTLTDIQTQMSLLKSESLFKQVSAKLKEQATATNLTVRADGQSRIVEVLYDSPDPGFAAAVVNTLAQEFIESNMEARWKMSERTSEWLTRQLEGMRNTLERSEDDLQSYARRAGLMFTSEKTNISEEKLRQLQEELSKAQADRITTQSRWEITRTSPPEALPDVLNDSSLRVLQDKVTDLRRQRAELIITYTDRHIKVRQVEAQIAPLEAALQKERSSIVDRIRHDFEAAQRREKLLIAEHAIQSRLVNDQTERSIRYNILKREVDSNRQLYEAMLQRVKEASIASAVRASNVRIVDPAEPPKFPYKPSFSLNALLGLLSGLLLGVAFVVARESADRTLRVPGEAQFWLNIPELQVIPAAAREVRGHLYDSTRGKERALSLLAAQAGATTASRNGKRAVDAPCVELITWQCKPSLTAESFRSLLTSVLFSGQNGDRPRVLVVTSGGPVEGKTTVASNLGIALAEITRKVLIVDGDLRKPRMHQIFSVSNGRGLSNLLGDPKGPVDAQDELVQETGIRGLFVLPSGPSRESTANLLHSSNLAELLARFKAAFDMVIIDTPPMLQMPDARVFGRMADAVILVTRAGHTTRDAALAASQRFAADKTRILGTILNDWDPKKTGRRDYGYGGRYYQTDHNSYSA
jgi:capsular exopolysaccharide synthesis family protein